MQLVSSVYGPPNCLRHLRHTVLGLRNLHDNCTASPHVAAGLLFRIREMPGTNDGKETGDLSEVHHGYPQPLQANTWVTPKTNAVASFPELQSLYLLLLDAMYYDKLQLTNWLTEWLAD
jgi:hypothetical protein